MSTAWWASIRTHISVDVAAATAATAVAMPLLACRVSSRSKPKMFTRVYNMRRMPYKTSWLQISFSDDYHNQAS